MKVITRFATKNSPHMHSVNVSTYPDDNTNAWVNRLIPESTVEGFQSNRIRLNHITQYAAMDHFKDACLFDQERASSTFPEDVEQWIGYKYTPADTWIEVQAIYEKKGKEVLSTHIYQINVSVVDGIYPDLMHSVELQQP